MAFATNELTGSELKLSHSQETHSSLAASISELSTQKIDLASTVDILLQRHDSAQKDADEFEKLRSNEIESLARFKLDSKSERAIIAAELVQLHTDADMERRNFRIERTRLHTEIRGLLDQLEEHRVADEQHQEERRIERMQTKAGYKALQEERQEFESKKKRVSYP